MRAAARTLKSLPSDNTSSSRARSGATSFSVVFVTLKFSSLLRSVKSRRRDFHFDRRPFGRVVDRVVERGECAASRSGSRGMGSMTAAG
jgi:hypothetical protein